MVGLVEGVKKAGLLAKTGFERLGGGYLKR